MSKPDTSPPGAGPGQAVADVPAPAVAASGAGDQPFDYSRLSLSSPLAEFESYARQKVRAAERLGRRDDVEVYLEAYELGRALLARRTAEAAAEPEADR
jgi:hypothetical protein